MGVQHTLYLEGWLEGRWVCMDSYVKRPDGEMVHRPLAAGRSLMRELLEDLDYHPLNLEALSPEVRKRVVEPSERNPFGTPCYLFDAEAIHVPEKKYEYERYVLREDMNQFENNVIDGIEYWLTEAEYAALDEEERRMYTFFRWDDPWSTFSLKRQLAERVKDAVRYYNATVMPHGSQIEKTRVVVVMS